MPLDFSQFRPGDFSSWSGGGFDPLQYLPQGTPAPQTAAPGGGATPSGGAASAPGGTVSLGGIDMPTPQAAQLPPQTSTPQPQSRGGRIHDALLGLLTGGTPAGYDGLLTPDEIKSARPSLMQALFPAANEPNAGSRFQRNLDALLEHKQLGVQVARAGQLQSDRARVEQQLGPAPDDEEGFAKWARRAYGMYSSIGDLDNVTKLNVVMQQILASSGASGKNSELFKGPKGELQYFNKSADTKIPPGWSRVATNTSGASTLFRAPDNAPKGSAPYVSIPNGDNDMLSKYTSAGYKPETTVKTEITQENAADRARAARQDAAVKEFRTNLAPYAKAAPVLQQSIVTIDKALNSKDINERKVLFSSAIANFVQAADPKAQIRWQLLNYFKENINASAEDRVKLLLTRLKDGTLPNSVLEGMAKHMQSLKGLMTQEIDAQRRAAVREHPGLDLDKTLRDASTFFPNDDEKSGAGSTDVNDVEGYLKTLRGKKK